MGEGGQWTRAASGRGRPVDEGVKWARGGHLKFNTHSAETLDVRI